MARSDDKPQFEGEWVRLNEICTKGKSSLRQKDLTNDGIYFVYGASGIVGTMQEYQNEAPYIAVVKDGAGVGRVMVCSARSSVLGTMQALIPTKHVECTYLFHLVKSLNLGTGFSGSTIPHIYFKDYGQIKVPLPSKDIQKNIIELFNSIEMGIEKQNACIEILDTLIKSRFIEMFGDLESNSMNWSNRKLAELGQFKNGINFSSDEHGYEYPCLGVGDFKNHSIIDSVANMGRIALKERPSEDYFLKKNDIVFVRSNGNKELVGRCLAIGVNERALFSGFCIRLRVTSFEVRISFLVRALKQEAMRRRMFGRGANVQNLNQRVLSEIQVPVPPLALQDEFLSFVQKVDKLKFAV